MPTFYFQWKVRDATRSDTLTLFASMDEASFVALRGEDVQVIGRWIDPGNVSGWGISEATSVKAFYKWLYNWSEEACDCIAQPVVDDDTARRLILAKAGAPACTWKSNYYDVDGEAKEGESLYVLTFKFFQGGEAKNAGFKIFSELTQEASEADCGPVRVIGRWHNLGDGSGVVCCAATTPEHIYSWGLGGWSQLLDFQIAPCVTDADFQEIVRAKPGYAQKIKAVQVKMGI